MTPVSKGLTCLSFLVSLAFLPAFLNELQAQRLSPDLDLSDSTQVHVLETKRGDRIVGRLLSIDQAGVSFQIRATSTILNIPLQEVEAIDVRGAERRSSSDPEEALRFENINVNPSAIPFRKGEGEYRNILLFYNAAEFGLTDNLSFQGGYFLPFYFLFRLKAAVPVGEYLHFGANGALFLSVIETSDVSVANFQGSVTIGKPDRYFNGSVGYGFVLGDPSVKYGFSGTIGGAYAFSDRWAFLGDILLVPNAPSPGIFPTLLGSWNLRKNRLDFGMTVFPGLDGDFIPLLPYLSYARRF